MSLLRVEMPAAGTQIRPSANARLDSLQPDHQVRPAAARSPLRPCLDGARDTRQDLEAALLASLLLEFGLDEREHMACFDRLGVRCVKVRPGAQPRPRRRVSIPSRSTPEPPLRSGGGS
jgi:hypothetical protein